MANRKPLVLQSTGIQGQLQAADSLVDGAGNAFVVPSGLSAALDAAFGSAQGSVLYRGASAWAALGPGTAGQVLQTGGPAANPSWATGGGGGGAMVLLGTVTTTAGQTSVTFSSISQAYSHLRVVAHAGDTGSSTTGTQSFLIRFNGDSGSNYDYTFLGTYGAGTGFGGGASPTTAINMWGSASTGATGVPPGQLVVDIADYASTTLRKTATMQSSAIQQNVGIAQITGGGSWTGTAAITSIVISNSDALAFFTGSKFWLYGIQ